MDSNNKSRILHPRACDVEWFKESLSRPDLAVQAQQGLWKSNIIKVIHIVCWQRHKRDRIWYRRWGKKRRGGRRNLFQAFSRLKICIFRKYLKIRLTGQAKTALSGLGFSSQAYYRAWDILCKKFGRKRVIVESQLKKIYSHPPVRHDDSSSIVRFSNVVTNKVNILTLLGSQSDLESEGVLSSATRKFLAQLMEQWLWHLQDHWLLAENLFFFKGWLESFASIHEDLLAQTNSKFQSREKPNTCTFASNSDDYTKPKNSECPFNDEQHALWCCKN